MRVLGVKVETVGDLDTFIYLIWIWDSVLVSVREPTCVMTGRIQHSYRKWDVSPRFLHYSTNVDDDR